MSGVCTCGRKVLPGSAPPATRSLRPLPIPMRWWSRTSRLVGHVNLCFSLSETLTRARFSQWPVVFLRRIRKGSCHKSRTNCFHLSRMVCWFCIFVEYRPTLRLSSSKVFSNGGNLGRHRKKAHHGFGLYHFSVTFHSAHIIHQPSRTTKTGPRQDAQLLRENTAALVLTNTLTNPSLLRRGSLLRPSDKIYF